MTEIFLNALAVNAMGNIDLKLLMRDSGVYRVSPRWLSLCSISMRIFTVFRGIGSRSFSCRHLLESESSTKPRVVQGEVQIGLNLAFLG